MSRFQKQLVTCLRSDVTGVFFNRKILDVRREDPLYQSVHENGILSPLLIFKKPSGQLFILDGLKRFHLAQALNIEHLPAIILENASFKDCLLLDLACHTESFKNPYLWIDIYHELVHLNEEPVFEVLVPMAGFSLELPWIRQIHKLSLLPTELREWAFNQNLPIKTFCEFLNFKHDDSLQLCKIFIDAKLNQNSIQEVLSWLFDIQRRDRVLPLKKLQEIVAQCPVEQRHVLGDYLKVQIKRLHQPHYQSHLERFERQRAKFKKQRFVQFKTAPYFEDDWLEVVAKIRSSQDIKELEDILKSPDFIELLGLSGVS